MPMAVGMTIKISVKKFRIYSTISAFEKTF